MAASTAFGGFSKDLPKFLSELNKNNNKAWFDEHRKDYERSTRRQRTTPSIFLEPAKQSSRQSPTR